MIERSATLISPDDRLLKLLVEKRTALSWSAKNFDAGHAWEAKRMANEIAILVHDPLRGKTISLLTRMNLKHHLRMIDSVAGHPIQGAKARFSPPTGLLGLMGTSEGWTVAATCQLGTIPSEFIEEVQFRRWWEDPVVFFGKGGALSRKNLVMSARDQDGGAHVDAEVEDKGYISLSLDLDSRLRLSGQPFKGAHLSCIRQIGWELIETLNRALGELPDHQPVPQR